MTIALSFFHGSNNDASKIAKDGFRSGRPTYVTTTLSAAENAIGPNRPENNLDYCNWAEYGIPMPARDRGILEFVMPSNIANRNFVFSSYPGFGGQAHLYDMTESEITADYQFYLLNFATGQIMP